MIEGIDTFEEMYEYIERNWGVYWRRVIIEDVLGLQMSWDTTQPDDLVIVIERHSELSMVDIATLSKEEWNDFYGLKIPPIYHRRLQVFHHWMANPYDDEKLDSVDERLTRLRAQSFDGYMMKKWCPATHKYQYNKEKHCFFLKSRVVVATQ